MKFTRSLSVLAVVLPLVSALAVPGDSDIAARAGRFGQGSQGNQGSAAKAAQAAAASKAAASKAAQAKAAQGAQANKGGKTTAVAATTAAAVTTAAASAVVTDSAALAAASLASVASVSSLVAAAEATAVASTADSNDPQTSLLLNPGVIASGFSQDGQEVPTAGQVASLTSTNNFMNFCLTVPNLPITNGKQITTGSCNPAPIGVIPAVGNMPSAKISSPVNGGTVPANTAFNITVNARQINLGNFVNAQLSYFAAPQTVASNGFITGHTHVTVEALTSLTQTTATDPTKFAFFKGIDGAQDEDGNVQAVLTAGLPDGAYRVCTINSSSNHQPVIVPVAQHGSLDDCSYFTATGSGAAANNAGSGTAAADTTAAAAVATTAAAADTSVAVAATATAAAGKNGKGGKGVGAVASSSVAVAASSSVAVAATATAVGKAGKGAVTTAVAATATAVGKAGKGAVTTAVAATATAVASTGKGTTAANTGKGSTAQNGKGGRFGGFGKRTNRL